MDLKRLEYMTCTESARVHLGVCRQVMTNIQNPYADHDIIRRSKVFVLRRIQAPHSSRMKNCPRVECRRVSISIGAIYKAAYGILSRRVSHGDDGATCLQRGHDASLGDGDALLLHGLVDAGPVLIVHLCTN